MIIFHTNWKFMLRLIVWSLTNTSIMIEGENSNFANSFSPNMSTSSFARGLQKPIINPEETFWNWKISLWILTLDTSGDMPTCLYQKVSFSSIIKFFLGRDVVLMKTSWIILSWPICTALRSITVSFARMNNVCSNRIYVGNDWDVVDWKIISRLTLFVLSTTYNPRHVLFIIQVCHSTDVVSVH
jgi:hypothetical protein